MVRGDGYAKLAVDTEKVLTEENNSPLDDVVIQVEEININIPLASR